MNKRLFVAIDPPEEIREQLAGICCGLPDARWTPPHQLHLTLCFIGEVSGAAFLDIREALEEISTPPFTLRLQGVGFFPPRGQPRVVWAGIEKNESLLVLQRKITTRLFALGFEPENRKFFPHITLARLQQTPPSGSAAISRITACLPPLPLRSTDFSSTRACSAAKAPAIRLNNGMGFRNAARMERTLIDFPTIKSAEKQHVEQQLV